MLPGLLFQSNEKDKVMLWECDVEQGDLIAGVRTLSMQSYSLVRKTCMLAKRCRSEKLKFVIHKKYLKKACNNDSNGARIN